MVAPPQPQPPLTLSTQLLASCLTAADLALQDAPQWDALQAGDAWFYAAARAARVELLRPYEVFAYAMSMYCEVARRHPQLLTDAFISVHQRLHAGAVERKWWAPLMDAVPTAAAPASAVPVPRTAIAADGGDAAVAACTKLLELAVTRRLHAVHAAHPSPATPFVWYDSAAPTVVPTGCHHAYIANGAFGCTRFPRARRTAAAPGDAAPARALHAALQYYSTGQPPDPAAQPPAAFVPALQAFCGEFEREDSAVRQQCSVPGSVYLLNALLRLLRA